MYGMKHSSVGFVVDILDKTCTCEAQLLSGIPCCHTLAVMKEEKLNPIQFVHDCYSIEKLRSTYRYTLQPINGSNMWPPSQHDPIVSSKFKKKKRGYNSFTRREHKGETRACRAYGTVSRSEGIVKCSACARI